MKFTQFIFPNGREETVTTEVPPEIEVKALELATAHWRFEIECNPSTSYVYMDCSNDDGQLADELCSNGPKVPETVVRLVERAHKTWVTLGKPDAIGFVFPRWEQDDEDEDEDS